MPFGNPGGSVAVTVTTGAFSVVTSGTRPLAPADGTFIYESDTGHVLIYNAGAGDWYPPWGTAWGQVASAGSGGNTVATTGGGYVNCAGLAVTFPALAARRYHAHASGHVLGAGPGESVASVAIVDAVGVQLGRPGRSDVIVGLVQAPFDTWSEFSPAIDGNYTLGVQLASLAGPNASIWNNVATATLTVTDVGPA